MGLPPLAAAVNETVNKLSPDAIEVIVGADGVLVTRPEVMTRLPVPVTATATNFSCPTGPPHVTEYHWLRLGAEEVRAVQAMPSGLVMTRLQALLGETATNFCCPAGPPHVTEPHLLFEAEVREVQVMPSALVMTEPKLLLSDPTATNFSCPAGPPQITELQLLTGELSRVQAMPSGLVMALLPCETATNFCWPVGPPHVTDFHL